MRRSDSPGTWLARIGPRRRTLAFTTVVTAIAAQSVTGAAIGLAGGGAKTPGDLAATARPDCPVTIPTAGFAPPAPYPAQPAGGFEGLWFGAAGLWTALPPNGRRWGPNTSDKTFWWSGEFDASLEPNPAIVVTARRLDAPGSAAAQEATHAFIPRLAGAAMLVGLELPTPGCWRLRAEYRGYSLEYVIEISPR